MAGKAECTGKIVKGGTIQGNERYWSDNFAPTSEADFGSERAHTPAQLGVSLTPADINAANFGVVVQITSNEPSTQTISIDHVRVEVVATPPAGAPFRRSLLGVGF